MAGTFRPHVVKKYKGTIMDPESHSDVEEDANYTFRVFDAYMDSDSISGSDDEYDNGVSEDGGSGSAVETTMLQKRKAHKEWTVPVDASSDIPESSELDIQERALSPVILNTPSKVPTVEEVQDVREALRDNMAKEAEDRVHESAMVIEELESSGDVETEPDESVPKGSSWLRVAMQRARAAGKLAVSAYGQPKVGVLEIPFMTKPLQSLSGFMGQSFKPSFGPSLLMAKRTGTTGVSIGHATFSAASLKLPLEYSREKVSSLLDISMGYCHSIGEGSPRLWESGVEPASLDHFVNTLLACIEGFMNMHSHTIEENQMEVEKLEHTTQTWKLVSALFKEIRYSTKGDTHAELEVYDRRALVSEWLRISSRCKIEDAIQNLAKSSASEKYLRAISVLLSGNFVSKAVKLAVANGDSRLGALLCAAAKHSRSRELIGVELELAKEYRRLETYSEVRQGIYELMSGDTEWVAGNCDLDWRRALGMHLWYQLPPNEAVEKAIAAYEAERKLPGSCTPAPTPHYKDPLPVGLRDTQYELFRLFEARQRQADLGDGQIGELLQVSGHSPDPCDVLLSWQLLTVLLSCGIIKQEDIQASPAVIGLHDSMMALCELLGLPEYAVFVALHLPVDSETRHTTIQEILRRNCPVWNDSETAVDFMIKELEIPEAWLDDALSVWYRSKGDRVAEFRHLVRAGSYLDAHKLFCTFVAPSLYQKGESADISDGIKMMLPRKHDILEWRTGAGLYHDYERIAQEASSAPQSDLLERFKEFEETAGKARIRWGHCGSTRENQLVHSTYTLMVEKLQYTIRS